MNARWPLLMLLTLGVKAEAMADPPQASADELAALRRQVAALIERVQALEAQASVGTNAGGAAPATSGPAGTTPAAVAAVPATTTDRPADATALPAAEKKSARIELGANGFAVSSADSNYVFRVRGYVQTDERIIASEPVDDAVQDGFLIRRARPTIEGTACRWLDYRVMLDFGAQASVSTANNSLLQDAYAVARLDPALQLQAGKFKEPVGLERLQSGANLLFAERAFPTQLVPNRDVGLQVQGDLADAMLRYEAGVFNGVADGGSGDFETTDPDKDVAGRLLLRPFASRPSGWPDLGLGIAGTYGQESGALRPYATSGAQRFFTYRASSDPTKPNVVADGEHWRMAPQAWCYAGPFGVLAEYVLSSLEVRQAGGGAGAGQPAMLVHTGWQAALSWFLTGERNGYRPVVIRHPVTGTADGGWGAWELAVRVSALEVDPAAFPVFADPTRSATQALSGALGLNWHLNRNLKLTLNYEHTEFRAAQGNPYASHPEDLIILRAQVGF